MYFSLPFIKTNVNPADFYTKPYNSAKNRIKYQC